MVKTGIDFRISVDTSKFDNMSALPAVSIILLSVFVLVVFVVLSGKRSPQEANNSWQNIKRNEPRHAGETMEAALKRKFLAFNGSELDRVARRYLDLQARGYDTERFRKTFAPELAGFIENHLWGELSDEERDFLRHTRNEGDETLFHLFEPRILLRATYLKSSYRSPTMTPIEFEKWCAKMLRAAGWSTQETKATGDQGADVIATKGDLRLVVQCKFYSSPVGNKAVQEAFAAKTHYAATHAMVVTNASFTPAAQRLSTSTRVILVHADDLISVDRWIQRQDGV
ncbi:restriction endonuclease [Rhizobium straminoryzae]|uniref:Restriction endonuclease n=1 Tax=Rhizobium straminoryzae TaxID=1387186 RepID=A0A549T0W5_9HYPH|nr:restriction endonuclease [Rhizobium straminoryzae]TRL35522.1 restriction endonuclease [Rhizobium straminoryzae]